MPETAPSTALPSPQPPLGQVLDSLNQGLVVMDRDLRIVLFNHWMEENTRLTRDQALGRVITEVFPELTQKGFAFKAHTVFKLGNYAFFSQRLHRYLIAVPAPQYLQNRFQYMQQNAVLVPLRGADGRIAFVCLCLQDITDSVTYQERLELSARRLEEMSVTDHLTQLSNRRFLFDRLAQEISRSCRKGESLSVCILDLDNFKNVNDTYGHLCGDHVLVQVAQILKSKVRPYDMVGRYGGEEFCLVLPNTALCDATLMVERLRISLAQTPINHEDHTLHVTFSAGIADLQCHPNPDADVLLGQADSALYRAKAAGRNRVETAPSHESCAQQ